ncbi:Kinetochore protein Spc24 [Cytospora paraplurivora]|uniref:Kinetochore protein Spc24 n=1 Tax=Cytospora paraplurivora TaxID=2898453 RepID=A0AAN9U1E8_9PEZI
MGKKDIFDDADSDNGEQAPNGKGEELKINEDYAKRFEYNKKREERQRLEEKFKGDESDDSSSSSEDETEDEDGFLATEQLDAEISATLQAIKNKDPRIYNKDVKFIKALDENAPVKDKKEKPMFLRDYHRERYMAGDTGADEEETNQPRTFVQEQADLKNNILAEINAAGDDDSDDGEGFIKAKAKSSEATPTEGGIHPSRKEKIKPAEVDPSLAEKDPDLFLSNFMAARAWVPEDGNRWEAFESDDGEGNDDADEWEAAYNLRFEDPTKSNEVLKSYSRKLIEARTVRREELTGRKKQRELEKQRKEEEKRQRHEERSRLKKLKIEEAEEKLRKIKKAAGISGKELKEEEWMRLLEGAWENNTWEEEMRKRFDDNYYAEVEPGMESSEDEEEDGASKKKKPKKPKWDDDIDIKDIIPDFTDEEPKPAISLSDTEAADEVDEEEEEDEEQNPSKKRKTTKDHKAERQAAKRASRQERSKIEALVEHQMELEDPTVLATSKKNKKPAGASTAGFRYRETSPQSFGLTPRDILLAPSDAALNEFAGLKKLATFRDKEKKKKDRKRLGKKARLREWRRDVFGREFEQTGPTFGFGGDRDQGADDAVDAKAKEVEAANGASKKKRKRSKGKKGAAEA